MFEDYFVLGLDFLRDLSVRMEKVDLYCGIKSMFFTLLSHIISLFCFSVSREFDRFYSFTCYNYI